MLIREKTMIFLDYALTGLQYISISVTLTAILSWCDIYFAMKIILRDLGVWCGVFNAIPKTRGFEKKSSPPAWCGSQESHLGHPKKSSPRRM